MNKKNIIFTLFVIALIQVSYANEVEVTEDEGVIVLTQENFDHVIGKYQYVLVKFYAPWCGHCKTMAPAYATAAGHFSSTDNIRLAKVDATIHKELATTYGVKGFPTLLFFNNGEKLEYQGGRKEEEIVQWINKKAGPSSNLLKSLDELELLKKKSKVAVVFFGDAKSELYSTYLSLSQSISDADFAHVHDHDIISKIQPKGGINTIVLFKQFDDLRNDFTGDFNIDELTSFIDQNKMPLFSEFDQAIAQAVFTDNKPCLFLFVSSSDKLEQYRSMFSELAKKFQGNTLVSYALANEGFGKRLADYIGVTEELCPTVRVVSNKKDQDQPQKFTFEGEINAENLMKFHQEFQDGQLKPFLKSEEIPAENNGNVKIVVGKNFDAIVLDQNKDVLVEFYAPWCGHCKKLDPIFEELGQEMKANPSIVIAKSDATANDIDGLGIQGFPTIRFFPSNNKALPGLDYTGERTLEGFQKYLNEQKTIQWEKKEEL